MYQNNAYIKVEKSTAAQYDKLICNIGQLITSARDKVAVEVNTTLLDTYWEIGRYIVEFEQNGNARAEYGKGLLKHIEACNTISVWAVIPLPRLLALTLVRPVTTGSLRISHSS